jgi:hypothetical protein
MTPNKPPSVLASSHLQRLVRARVYSQQQSMMNRQSRFSSQALSRARAASYEYRDSFLFFETSMGLNADPTACIARSSPVAIMQF